jgi:phospholipase A-2-activating protein
LCVFGDSAIATGSRDKSIRCWYPAEGEKNEYILGKTLIGHTSFVGPVSWIPPSEELPGGGLISGGMDTRVIVWDLETNSAIEDLRGHELQVTSVAVEANGDFLSASVDRYFISRFLLP